MRYSFSIQKWQLENIEFDGPTLTLELTAKEFELINTALIGAGFHFRTDHKEEVITLACSLSFKADSSVGTFQILPERLSNFQALLNSAAAERRLSAIDVLGCIRAYVLFIKQNRDRLTHHTFTDYDEDLKDNYPNLFVNQDRIVAHAELFSDACYYTSILPVDLKKYLGVLLFKEASSSLKSLPQYDKRLHLEISKRIIAFFGVDLKEELTQFILTKNPLKSEKAKEKILCMWENNIPTITTSDMDYAVFIEERLTWLKKYDLIYYHRKEPLKEWHQFTVTHCDWVGLQKIMNDVREPEIILQPALRVSDYTAQH